jgi:hypothetical protein
MKLKKSVMILGLVGCVFCSAAFAGVNPEWRPFTLGCTRSGQIQAPPQGATYHAQTVELTLWGGYLGGSGLLKPDNVAADLLTGNWSPWFGQGYASAPWGGAAERLDGLVAGPMLRRKGGILAGFSLGFAVSTSMQAEVYFQYGSSGFVVDDDAWANLSAALDRSVEGARLLGAVESQTNSFKEAGKTIGAGVNLNFLISTYSAVAPYVSLGVGVLYATSLPSVAWSLSRSAGGASATYNLAIEYGSRIAPLASLGLGLKLYLDSNYKEFQAPNFGVKVEARAAIAMIDAPKTIGCGFATSHAGWGGNFSGYNGQALQEIGFPMMFSLGAGLFYAF